MIHLRSSILFIVVSGMLLCSSCSTCNRPEKLGNITVSLDSIQFDSDELYLLMSQKVIYALPTPIEASMLIKDWGKPRPELLNNPENVSGYLTKKKQALNFGIYTTDMATAGIYEQTQTVLRYKETIAQLVEAMGLQSAADPKLMQKMEDNINNKNELLTIVSDLYASCTEFLSNDDRDFYALAMLTGGWVEGMFIATNSIEDEGEASSLEKMKQIVHDNKQTFDVLWEELGRLDDIPDEAVYLMLDMSYVAHLFGHETLVMASKRNDPKNDFSNVTRAYFDELKSHIHTLRQEFIKISVN